MKFDPILILKNPKSAIDFWIPVCRQAGLSTPARRQAGLPDGRVCRQAGRVLNTHKNAMQYKENHLQILMIMIIV